MLEMVFAPAADWIGKSDEDIMSATMKVIYSLVLVPAEFEVHQVM